MSRLSYSVSVAMLVCAFLGAAPGWADPTPPIMPQITETPLPPPVTLPAPETVPADVPNAPLTATEAAQIALHHNPAIVVAQQGVIASQGRVQQAKSGQAATLGFTAGYTDLAHTNNNGKGVSNGFSTGASVRQLLYDFNHTRDAVRQSVTLEQSAQANLTRAQSDLVFQTNDIYCSILARWRAAPVGSH